MGNKSSKKTEPSTTMVTKHHVGRSYRGPEMPSSQLPHESPQWMMVLNATAYIQCGSQSSGTATANSTSYNTAGPLPEQISGGNKPAALLDKSNTLALHSSSSSNTAGNQVPQRQLVTVGVDAVDMLMKNLQNNYNNTSVEKSSKITPLEDKQQTVQIAERSQREHTVALKADNVYVNKATATISTLPQNYSADKKRTTGTNTYQNVRVNKATTTDDLRPQTCNVIKKTTATVACNTNYNNVITHNNQDVNKATATVATLQHNVGVTEKKPTTVTNNVNVLTVYNTNIAKDRVDAWRTGREGHDWFNTLTSKTNETKQQANHTEKVPPQIVHNEDERSNTSYMWRQVNTAEKGCWYHFHRSGNGYKCVLCSVFMPGSASVIEHVWGKFHQANLAKKRLNENQEDLIWRQVPKPEKLHRKYIYEVVEYGRSLFYCSICEVDIPFTYQNVLTHIRGRNHRDEAAY